MSEQDNVHTLPFPIFEPDSLSLTTPHIKDTSIQFEEEAHVYRCQFEIDAPFEDNNILSTSGIVHKHFPHFNADNVIHKMMKSRNWYRSKYHGMTAREIKTMWNDNGRIASERGTLLHFLLECHNNGYDLKQSIYANLPDIKAYFKWREIYFDAKNLIPFRTEMRMRTGRDLRVTGTADLLAIKNDHPPPSDTDGVLTLHMIDWKFSKGIQKDNKYENGSGPCTTLPNCNYSHYLLQQNLYKWLLETYYNDWTWRTYTYTQVNIVSKHLAIFHKNHGEDGYLYMPLPDCPKIIKGMMDHRKHEVTLLMKQKRKIETLNIAFENVTKKKKNILFRT